MSRPQPVPRSWEGLRRQAIGRALAAGLMAASLPAGAHSPSTGLKGLYAGVLHPWGHVPGALLLIVLGLWLGQGRRACAPVVSALATVSTLVAAAAGLLPPLPAAAVLLAAVAVGLLLILAWPSREQGGRAAWVAPVLAPLAFVLAAWAGGPDAPLPRELASLWSLTGMALGCWLMPAYAALAAMALQRRGWLAVGLRVIGAWIVAAALLVLVLQLRAPA